MDREHFKLHLESLTYKDLQSYCKLIPDVKCNGKRLDIVEQIVQRIYDTDTDISADIQPSTDKITTSFLHRPLVFIPRGSSVQGFYLSSGS